MAQKVFDLYPNLPEPTSPDWSDVEALSLYSPQVHACLALHDRGDLTREEALIVALFALYNAQGSLHRDAVNRLRKAQPDQTIREAVARLIWRAEREFQQLTDGQFGSIEEWKEVIAARAAIAIPEVK